MLKFILGKSGYGKTETVFADIKNRINNENKVLLIVPEQYSYETERKVMTDLGDKGSANVTVTSFSRFSENILIKNGGVSTRHADDITKMLVMSLAVKEVSEELKAYSNQVESVSFYEDMIAITDEFIDDGVSYEELTKLTETIDGATKDKLCDIALIYSAYEALLKNKGISIVSDISLASEILASLDDYEKYDAVYFDGFKSFTVDEMQMIKVLLSLYDEVYVTLCTLPEFFGKNTIFQTPSETYIDLCKICDEDGITYKIEKILDEPLRFNNEAIKYFSANVFKNKIDAFDGENTGVTVVKAPDMEKECRFVGAKIRQLVLKEGYSYKDITIVGRGITDYTPYIESALNMYDVPFFFNAEESILKTSVALFCTSAFEAVGFNTEKVLSFAKTGLAGLSLKEVSMLENYCYSWDIKNRLWFSDFTARRHSDNEVADEKYAKELEQINDLRKRIVTPLEKFADTVKNGNGAKISKAVYKLILDCKVKETLANKVAKMLEESKEDEARKLRQIWDRIVEVLEIMNTVLGDKPISYKNYFEIFKKILLKTTFTAPPQYIDTVTVGDAGLMRMASAKVVFIVGANEGRFPADNLSCSLLSAYERKTLENFGLKLSYPDVKLYNEERFVAYEALSWASEQLFITYSLTDSGFKEQYPSVIPLEAITVFNGVLRDYSDFKADFYCTTKSALYDYCASKYYFDDEDSATARKSASLIPELDSMSKALNDVAFRKEYEITDKTIMNKLVGDDVYISATRIEDYYTCKFLHFCKYGLRLRALQTVEMDSRLTGSLLHYCLEVILKEHFDELPTLTKARCIALSKEIINEYIDENCGGTEDKSNSYKNKLGRFAVRVAKIIEHLQKEFAQCDFRPVGFETSIGREDEVVPEIIRSDEGKNIFISGKIDRVDLYECDGKKYIRVIDYKSSGKEMKLEEIVSGRNLQMILYLFILTLSEKSQYNGCIPAGAFYSTLADYKLNKDNSLKGKSDEEKEQMLIANYALNGLMLDDEVSKNAMCKENSAFIKVNDNLLTNLEEMTLLKEYCQKMIKGMVDEFTKGKIPAIPAKINDTSVKCDYCDYYSICCNEGKVEVNTTPKMDKTMFYDYLRKGGDINEA